MTAAEAIVALRAAPNRVARAEERTLVRACEIAQGLAEDYSSGPYSTADLAAMGHPYARRHPHAGLDPSLINIQSGAFVSGWETLPPEREGGALVGRVVNNTPEAAYLGTGTKTMVRRPITDRVMAEVEPQIPRLFEAAWEGTED